MMIDVDGQTETEYYYHFDGLGSVIALSDTSRNIVERYSYDVFGEPNTTSSIGNPYMFTGRRYDSETGFYYYRARYYAYDIGRFLQTDPMGYDDGLNLYTYVRNNPINQTDPFGLVPINLITGKNYIIDAPASPPRTLSDHMEKALPYDKLVDHASGKTFDELIWERSFSPVGWTIPAGPYETYQYVIDPANPSQVIDMTHFLSVGPDSVFYWHLIEIMQLLRYGQESAYHPQDMWSNRLGRDFYENYYLKYPHLPLDMLLETYFGERGKKGGS